MSYYRDWVSMRDDVVWWYLAYGSCQKHVGVYPKWHLFYFINVSLASTSNGKRFRIESNVNDSAV